MTHTAPRTIALLIAVYLMAAIPETTPTVVLAAVSGWLFSCWISEQRHGYTLTR